MQDNQELKMKTRNKSMSRPEGRPERRVETVLAAEFHSERIDQETAIENKKQSAVQPVGNDEYQQSVAEDAGCDARPMIERAAYLLAEARGFGPGKELSDWLQAEAEVEVVLRRTH